MPRQIARQIWYNPLEIALNVAHALLLDELTEGATAYAVAYGSAGVLPHWPAAACTLLEI